MFRFKYDIPHALSFDASEQVEIQPEALTRIGEMKTLDKLLTGNKTNKKEILIFIGAGVMIGVVVGIMLVATGMVDIMPATASTPLPPLPPIPSR